ncbi:hypothetical protein ABW20_dc0102938 [Dactylellina cionopaga]|nr:hypothetical protein ABW20_dc0102938 [Dactylellina cionopaga]
MVSTRLAVWALATASLVGNAFALPHGRVEMNARAVTVTHVVSRPIVKVFVVLDQDGNTVSSVRTTVFPDATPEPIPVSTVDVTSTTKKTRTRTKYITKTRSSSAAPAATSDSSSGGDDTPAPPPVKSSKLGTGIVYSPYHDDGTCKDQATVASEVKTVLAAGSYNWLRIYGTDCEQVTNVLTAAYANGAKVMLGIYDIADDAKFQTELSTLISGVKAANKASNKDDDDWSGVAFISVGNEVVNQHSSDAETWVQTALKYAATTRAAVKAAGYTGSVGNTDVWFWYKNFPALCGTDKLVTINMHPFFDQSCDVAGSGAFLKTHLAEVQAACGADKEVIITETGWPTAGDKNFNAIPGKAQQAQFLQLAADNLDMPYVLLTAYDEGWKPATPSVERHWGILGTSPSH